MNRKLVQSRQVIGYSNSLIILRWEAENKDFQYRYWGSNLTNVYGTDLTNQYISDGGHKEFTQPFIDAHFEVIQSKKTLFLGGNIDWKDKQHTTWDQVILPLEDNSEITETLTFVQFNY